MRRIAFLVTMCVAAWAAVWADTSIMGRREATVVQMYLFVSHHNPDFDPAIAQAFADMGDLYGIRGDVALCQAVKETGWFRFANTAVRPEAHNYCGLGVKRNGQEGCKFESVDDGVRAMMQHLYAYATTGELPEGETLVDPRFKQVQRGSATSWEALSGRWAMNPSYGADILSLHQQLLKL